MAATRVPVWFGGVFMAIGLGIIIMVRLAPAAANAPQFVLDAVAGVFFLAGLSTLLHTLNLPLAARFASLLLVYLFAIPGLWMLFGDDVGACTVQGSVAGLAASAATDPTMCRVIFGGGAILVLLLAAAFTVDFVRRLRRKPA
jgi:hypothetical protein